MRRRFSNPDDQKLANRWMAINLAIYGTLMLGTLLFAHLDARSANEHVVQAPATATALPLTMAQ